tara:strand:- start:125 stop:250 length:126 start_codon:yes stop_codon:yes gene_type:complete
MAIEINRSRGLKATDWWLVGVDPAIPWSQGGAGLKERLRID